MIATIRVYKHHDSCDITICVYNNRGKYIKLQPGTSSSVFEIKPFDIAHILEVLGVPCSCRAVSYEYLDTDTRGKREAIKGECDCSDRPEIVLIGYDYLATKEYTYICLVNEATHKSYTWNYNKTDDVGLSVEAAELLLSMLGFNIKFQGNKSVEQCARIVMTNNR